MAPISSLSNARIKQIRALRNRKEREHTGLFFIEGLRAVSEAVQLRADIETLVVAPELLKGRFGHDIVKMLRQAGTPCLEVTAEVFESLAAKDIAQGVAAVVRQRWETLEHVRLAPNSCWIALDAVQYPGNLGTILRTCDAVGSAGVILLGTCTDPYDPVAVRASVGAIFGQRLVRTQFEEFARWKHRHAVMVVGSSPSASLDYRAVTYRTPLVLLMGCERLGLSPDQQALCDVIVNIPMIGRSDSLNLAVATGIILYEIFYQQRSAA